MRRNALHDVLMGAAAGAVGTVTLNIVTYGDMAVRGRPPSHMPAKVAATLTRMVGIDVFSGWSGASSRQPASDQAAAKAEHRAVGLGRLMGFATGLGVGAAYGALRPRLRHLPGPVAGAALGLIAMAATDGPMTVLGLTNPTQWGWSGWLEDVIPHLAYGLVTAVAFQAFVGRRR